MLDQRHIVSIAFRIFGCAVGLPSLLLFLDITINLLMLSFHPVSDGSPPLDIGKYGLAGLLSNAVQAICKVLGAFSAIASWLMIIVAAMALLAVLFALLLYFTGAGIESHAKWARYTGLTVSIVFLLISFGAVSFFPRSLLVVPGITAVGALYVCWVLGWKCR